MGQLHRISWVTALAAGMAAPAAAQDEFYIADLSGGIRGEATLTLEWRDSEDEGERFCYAISGYGGLSGAVSAHLHRGAGGPIVMEFNAPGGAENGSDGCVSPDAGLREEIAANPSAFIADVHTAAGSVSGPLER